MQAEKGQDLGMDVRRTESPRSASNSLAWTPSVLLEATSSAPLQPPPGHQHPRREILLPLPSASEENLHNRHRPNTLPLDGPFQSLEMKNGLRA